MGFEARSSTPGSLMDSRWSYLYLYHAVATACPWRERTHGCPTTWRRPTNGNGFIGGVVPRLCIASLCRLCRKFYLRGIVKLLTRHCQVVDPAS